MKLFQESGAVCVVPVASIPMMSEYGTKTKNILAHTHPVSENRNDTKSPPDGIPKMTHVDPKRVPT